MTRRHGLSVNSSHTYTMRELNQRTAEVMREINESGQPAVITRHGRFIAIVTPLAGEQVEAAALSATLAAIENRRQFTGDSTASQAVPLDEAADQLGVKWRPRKSRR